MKGKSQNSTKLFNQFSEQYSKSLKKGAKKQPSNPSIPSEKKPKLQQKPLESLTLISVTNLKIGTIHQGCFLKLNAIHKPIRQQCIMVLAEDHTGENIIIHIYNLNTQGKHQNEIFTMQTTFFVKEPFYQMAQNGGPIIRIDDPSQIVFDLSQEAKEMKSGKQTRAVPEDKDQIAKLEQFRLQGIDLIKKQEYANAYEVYSNALKLCKNFEYKIKFMTNKAIVCCRLNLIKEYGQIIQEVIKIDPNNPKGPYHLIKYEILSKNLEKKEEKIVKSTLDQASKQELAKLLQIERRSSTQKIDWFRAIKFRQIGEYFHKNIKFDKSPFGVGIFSTKQVKAGQILIVQKPLIPNRKVLQKDQDSNYDRTNKQTLIQDSIKLFDQSEEFKSKFNTLSSSFGLGNKQFLHKKNMKDFTEVMERNWFELWQIQDLFRAEPHPPLTNIYEKISMINHSCEYNCDRFSLGNAVIVYCVRDIPQGEELFINYKPLWDYTERHKQLKYRGIDCRCIFCEEQLKDIENVSQQNEEKSWQLKKLKLVRQILLENQLIKALDELEKFYDMKSIYVMLNMAKDANRAASMLRKVLPMTKQQSQELINLWRGS